MPDPVIVSAVRTATGKFGGSLASVPVVDLGGHVLKAAAERAGLDPAGIDEVIMGSVYQGGMGPNVCRQAAVAAGLPYEVPSMTVNKLCGSGLKAIALAGQAIRCGEAEVLLAGGMENMSRVPHVLPDSRSGMRLGHGQALDMLLLDGLWDCFYDCHMGITAENLADRYGIGRDEQDGFAQRSQERAVAAIKNGLFKAEIAPLEVDIGRGKKTVFAEDEYPRADSTLEKLSALRPAFKKDGTVTAGNASGINDGAAAVAVMSESAANSAKIKPLAYLRAVGTAGVDPQIMGLGPAPAIRRLLEKAGIELDQIDLIEVNEAFAAQTLAVGRELDLDPERLNVNGGAIALGHPVGASGGRVAVSLLHEMGRRQARWGIAALCIGGGMGIAALFERAA